MKDTRKKIICMLLVFTIVFTAGISVKIPAQAKGEVDCKSLCVAALKATGGGKKLKYTSTSAIDFGALSVSERGKVAGIQYVCDAKEVYSLCVIETKKASQAKGLLNALKKYKKRNCSSDYLSDYTATEKKVLKNAIYGKKGKYVWYIAMSSKKENNNKGQAAIKEVL